MTTEPVDLEQFRAGTMQLAMENGYPVITPAGTFIHDARAAWLVEAVESWHEESQEPRVDGGWFHASSLYKSDEELIAAYRGGDVENHDARRLRIFDLGHDRDRAWKRYIRLAGLTVAVEHLDGSNPRKMLLPWLRLVGECDDIVQDPDGRLCIIEIKTKAQYMFARLEEPDPAHKLQVAAYMGGMGITQAIIVYEAKNDQSIKAFYEPFDVTVWNEIVKRLMRLRVEAESDQRGDDPEAATTPAS